MGEFYAADHRRRRRRTNLYTNLYTGGYNGAWAWQYYDGTPSARHQVADDAGPDAERLQRPPDRSRQLPLTGERCRLNKPRSRFLIPGVTLAMVAVVAVGLGRAVAEPARRSRRHPPPCRGARSRRAARARAPAPPAAARRRPDPPPPTRRAAASDRPTVDSLNEAVLMARLRSAGGSDAALAIVLARSGNRRFPDSPEAPERASILIHALASQGLSSEARGEAEYMVNHYPDSSWVREVEQFTGAHRHRNLRGQRRRGARSRALAVASA